MTFVDLSHPITSFTPVYPGDPAIEFEQLAQIQNDGFTMFSVKSGMHVGTHMDAPLHFVAESKRIDEIPVERFFGRGVLLDARGIDTIDAELLEGIVLNTGDIVLVMTGQDKVFGSEDYFTRHPVITTEFAHRCVDAQVSIVGMDMATPDYEPYETHKLLLQNDIFIIENLVGLDRLVGVASFEVVALPVRYATEAAPVRVVARY